MNPNLTHLFLISAVASRQKVQLPINLRVKKISEEEIARKSENAEKKVEFPNSKAKNLKQESCRKNLIC